MIGSAESQNKFKDKQVERRAYWITTIYTGFKRSTVEFGIKIFIYATVWERWNIGGSYTFGSLSIEVYPSSGGLTVDILDTKQESKHK
jgi:curli production assembly/transport component CsgF